MTYTFTNIRHVSYYSYVVTSDPEYSPSEDDVALFGNDFVRCLLLDVFLQVSASKYSTYIFVDDYLVMSFLLSSIVVSCEFRFGLFSF